MSTLTYPPIPTLSPEMMAATKYAPRIPIRPRKPKAMELDQQAQEYFAAAHCLRQRVQELMMFAAEASAQGDTETFQQLTTEARGLGLAAIWLSLRSQPAQAASSPSRFN